METKRNGKDTPRVPPMPTDYWSNSPECGYLFIYFGECGFLEYKGVVMFSDISRNMGGTSPGNW